jgi:hypothetical protein
MAQGHISLSEGILDVAAAVGSAVTVGGATAAGRLAGAWGPAVLPRQY